MLCVRGSLVTNCTSDSCDPSVHLLPERMVHTADDMVHNFYMKLEIENARKTAKAAESNTTAAAASNPTSVKMALSPGEPVKQCPMPRCDSTGNTKLLYAFHRSVSRCPLVRIKIEGLKGILTIKQVDDILARRIDLPNWSTVPEPTTKEGKELLEDLIQFVSDNPKKKQANGGKQQRQSGGSENNDENRSPKVAESVTTATTVSSTGDAHSRNTRNSASKKAASASANSTKPAHLKEENYGPSPRFIPNPPATAASKTANVPASGGATANKVFHKRNNNKKSTAAASEPANSGGGCDGSSIISYTDEAAGEYWENYHSQKLHYQSNNNNDSFTESFEPQQQQQQHISFLPSSAAKNKRMMVVKKEEKNGVSFTKLSNVKPSNSLIANHNNSGEHNNGTAAAAAAPREMILIGPRKDAVKQSFNKGKVIAGKKSSKVIKVNNENANGCNGTKRKLAETEESTTFNGDGLKAKRKAITVPNKVQLIVPTPDPPKPSTPPFGLLNCDLDSFDLSEEQTRHLKCNYKQTVQKVKTLQDTEFALARRLSAAQKGIEVLRPKKAQLESALEKATQDFTQICREITPLNAEPLSAECTVDETINAYLQRIALLSEQSGSSAEAESTFNLVKEQLKDFWLAMQMNPHRSSHRRPQSLPCKSPEPSRPQSTLSSHSQ